MATDIESDNAKNSDTKNDGLVISKGLELLKSLDANKYATKKTIAQGLLDVALLTANASQLKYVLQVGEKHEFYTLMLSLIIISMVLQLAQACLCVLLGAGLDINKQTQQTNADRANNIILVINIFISAVNILISSFEMKEDSGSSQPS